MVVLRLLEGHHRELDLCQSSLPSSAPTRDKYKDQDHDAMDFF
ncbi:hypothetical protein BDA96_05G070400 [Sorghum bicolor]|uniref:Uncharacterized protein n=2 Tax=Sorghum bicolor TaxID=4558 RepID=A0A921QWC4_SORBI|nr:hypothetical protein BDA96_05G070400 [Sorghum bicolor]OQU83064.1 hypothetical protein SORBI_3005G070101 [Sorghum bicolor]